jgi:hypothetical protein
MKPIAAALLILASVLTIHFANGASTPDRPAGVDAQHWIPVSDKMGFVVTTPSIPGALVTTDRQALSDVPTRWFAFETSASLAPART